MQISITPDALKAVLPLLLSLTAVSLIMLGLRWWMRRHEPANPEAHLPRQLLTLGLWCLGIVAVLLSLPVSETTRGQLLSLLGLVLTALIALSSTTLVANAMAGLLLRIVNSFQPGDFIRVGDHFGRVSERGLFHTEVQTEERDLLTVPNMHLITNPVKVVHKEGTIITANLSLGYELHHARIEKLLKQAAEQSGLLEPFAQVLELGDFSVVYRVGGKLEDVSSLITARSRLRSHLLDVLHDDSVEIVSPGFIVQRPQTNPVPAIPKPQLSNAQHQASDSKLEDMIFDKAEQASQEQQRLARIDHIRAALAQNEKDPESQLSAQDIEQLQTELTGLEQMPGDEGSEKN